MSHSLGMLSPDLAQAINMKRPSSVTHQPSKHKHHHPTPLPTSHQTPPNQLHTVMHLLNSINVNYVFRHSELSSYHCPLRTPRSKKHQNYDLLKLLVGASLLSLLSWSWFMLSPETQSNGQPTTTDFGTPDDLFVGYRYSCDFPTCYIGLPGGRSLAIIPKMDGWTSKKEGLFGHLWGGQQRYESLTQNHIESRPDSSPMLLAVVRSVFVLIIQIWST